jgi:tetratricopeptide (TPR) repeat protein
LYRRARFAVAQSLIALKRYDGAMHELEALHKAEPAAPISNAIGIAHLRRASVDGSSPATYFARAVREAPANTTYLFNLGYAHALASNNAEALTSLRETVRLDPTDGDAHLVMSAVLGKTPEGQRELELARSLGASVDPALAVPGGRLPPGLERVDVDLGSSPAARPAPAAPSQRDQQETAAFHLARAKALIAERRDTEAIEALRRSVYLSPYADEPHLLLGTLYRRAGRLSEAIDAFKIAIWSRETAAAHVALGNALLDAGDTAGAKRSADRALVLAPTSEPARELLKRLGG